MSRSDIVPRPVEQPTNKRTRDHLLDATAAGSALARETRRHSSFFRRVDLLNLGVLLLIWLLVSVPRLKGPIDLRWDAATYYILGTSLAEGKGYRLLNEPGEIHAVQYPPLLPALVAVTERLMGTSDFVVVGSRLRLIYFFLSGMYLVAIYVLARHLLAPAWALAVSAITGLSFNSFVYPSDSLYAELPFALVLILFLLSVSNSNRGTWKVASGVFAVAAYLLRTAGIVLLVAWVAESLLRRRFLQAAVRASISAIPILAWHAYVSGITHSSEYRQPTYSYQRAPFYYANVTYSENSALADPFRPERGRTGPLELLARMARNAIAIPFAIGESSWFDLNFGLAVWSNSHRRLAIPLEQEWRERVALPLRLCLTLTGLFAVAGALMVTARGDKILSLCFFLTIGVVLVTPWQTQFWRYVAPIAPLALMFIATTLLSVGSWLTAKGGRWQIAGRILPTLWLGGMLLFQIPMAIMFLHGLFRVSYYDTSGRERPMRLLAYQPEWHALDKAFEFVRRQAPPSAIVATSVPHLAYLRTGHKSVLPPMDLNPENASRLLGDVPVSYLVLDQIRAPAVTRDYAAPVVARSPDEWKLVFEAGPGTEVYERILPAHVSTLPGLSSDRNPTGR